MYGLDLIFLNFSNYPRRFYTPVNGIILITATQMHTRSKFGVIEMA